MAKEIEELQFEGTKLPQQLEVEGEKMVLNMGPQHPSTHGVLRLVLRLDALFARYSC